MGVDGHRDLQLPLSEDEVQRALRAAHRDGAHLLFRQRPVHPDPGDGSQRVRFPALHLGGQLRATSTGRSSYLPWWCWRRSFSSSAGTWPCWMCSPWARSRPSTWGWTMTGASAGCCWGSPWPSLWPRRWWGPSPSWGSSWPTSPGSCCRTYRHTQLVAGSALFGMVILVAGQLLVEHVYHYAVPISVFITVGGGIYFPLSAADQTGGCNPCMCQGPRPSSTTARRVVDSVSLCHPQGQGPLPHRPQRRGQVHGARHASPASSPGTAAWWTSPAGTSRKWKSKELAKRLAILTQSNHIRDEAHRPGAGDLRPLPLLRQPGLTQEDQAHHRPGHRLHGAGALSGPLPGRALRRPAPAGL